MRGLQDCSCITACNLMYCFISVFTFNGFYGETSVVYKVHYNQRMRILIVRSILSIFSFFINHYGPHRFGPIEIDRLLVHPVKAYTLLTVHLINRSGLNRSGLSLPRKSCSSQTIHNYKT